MRFVSWNVNGIRAALKKDFVNWLAECEADVVCLQEVKARQEQVDLSFADKWNLYWNPAEKAGYSGVASLSRKKPLDVFYGIDQPEHDKEGRVLTLEFEDYFVVNCYTPNAQNELRRLPYRQCWDRDFREFLLQLEQQKPVFLGGDLNVAHQEIDLARPKANRFSAGFSDEERAGMDAHLQAGFVDTFRYVHPEKTAAYSWWSYRGQARKNNVGWRIDYWLCSQKVSTQIKSATIHADVLGSDHCPVSVDLHNTNFSVESAELNAEKKAP